MSKTKIVFLLLLSVFLFYLPVFLNPSFLLGRDNDLSIVFQPIFYFIRSSLLAHRAFPLWNNLIFSGTPLLPDPQFSPFYPPNWLLILLPFRFSFLSYFFLHSLLAAFSTYLLSRRLHLPPATSLLSSFLFTLSPKFAGILIAGHPGLFAAYCWIPPLFYFALANSPRPCFRYSLLAALSLSAIFFSHTVIFILASASFILLSFSLLLIPSVKSLLSNIFSLTATFIILFGLTAIALLPQIQFISNSTRSLLLKHPLTFPIWSSIWEFPATVFFPLIYGLSSFYQTDPEKWLTLGLIPSLLALYGFSSLKRSHKLILFLTTFTVLIVSLNNLSPLYPLLIQQFWFILMRVATRPWFIPMIVISLLAGRGLNQIQSRFHHKHLSFFIAALAISESFLLSWLRITSPINLTKQYAPLPVYQFLAQDSDRFRVFCTTRCLSQAQAALYHLELIEGYNTLQQINYTQHAWQLTGSYWDYYTLAIPPIGSYLIDQPQPDAWSLGRYNTKYVISPYPLADPAFSLIQSFGQFNLYRNSLHQARAYSSGTNLPLSRYSPNFIQVQIPKPINQIILAEVYSPGWKAYLNGQEEVPIQETPNALRAVDLAPGTDFVNFKYRPPGFALGSKITLLTLVLLLGYFFYHNRHD